MKKTRLFFYLFVCIGTIYCNVVVAEDNYNLSVESISITKISPTDCACKWNAVVKNNGATSVPANNNISATAYQGKDGADWKPASGTLLSSIAPNGGTASVGNITFVRLGDKNQIKLVLFRQGAVIAEKIVSLPAEPQPSLTIENCQLSENHYTVTVRNQQSESVSDITLQGMTAATAAADPQYWAAGGGMILQCLKGGASYQHTGVRPAENQVVKMMVYRGGTIIAQQVFDFNPPPVDTSSQGRTIDKENSLLRKPTTKKIEKIKRPD